MPILNKSKKVYMKQDLIYNRWEEIFQSFILVQKLDKTFNYFQNLFYKRQNNLQQFMKEMYKVQCFKPIKIIKVSTL